MRGIPIIQGNGRYQQTSIAIIEQRPAPPQVQPGIGIMGGNKIGVSRDSKENYSGITAQKVRRRVLGNVCELENHKIFAVKGSLRIMHTNESGAGIDK
jgi:hypothetical protein